MSLALALLAPVLTAAGFLVCEGIHLKELTGGKAGTQWTRAIGAALFLAGGWCVAPGWGGIALGWGLVFGIWTELEHGEGQRDRVAQWKEDLPALMVSGVTRLLPVAWVAFNRDLDTGNALLIAGLIAKPGLWFMANQMVPQNWTPTRWAAGAFGLLVGLVLVGLGA